MQKFGAFFGIDTFEVSYRSSGTCRYIEVSGSQLFYGGASEGLHKADLETCHYNPPGFPSILIPFHHSRDQAAAHLLL